MKQQYEKPTAEIVELVSEEAVANGNMGISTELPDGWE